MIVVMNKTNPLHMYMKQFCPLSAMKEPWMYISTDLLLTWKQA